MNRNFHNWRGSSAQDSNPIPRWRIVFIVLMLAITFGSAGQTPQAQAAQIRESVNFSMKVEGKPKTTLKCGETVTYFVKVELQKSGMPTPDPQTLGAPKGLGVVKIKVEGSSVNTSVGDFVGNKTVSTTVIFDDDLTSLAAKFKFKAKKPGKTTLYFEGLVGDEYVTAKLDVKVIPCKFKVTTVGQWSVPGPANIFIAATSDDATVEGDEQASYKGSTTVNWVLTTSQVVDCIPQSVTTSSQVDWTGQTDDSGQLNLNGTYQSVAMSVPVYCVGSDGGIASGSTPFQLTADPVQVSMLSEGGVFKQPQVLEGPEGPISGSVTIIVVPDDEAIAFIPRDHQLGWDDFLSLFGALLALH